jgi:hypothetical protein
MLVAFPGSSREKGAIPEIWMQKSDFFPFRGAWGGIYLALVE